MTLFKLLLIQTGLSTREASIFLNIRPDTAKSWSINRRTPPEAALTELIGLWQQIEDGSQQGIKMIAEKRPPIVELNFCVDDKEAQNRGLPFKSCHEIMISRVAAYAISKNITVELVPVGSTLTPEPD